MGFLENVLNFPLTMIQSNGITYLDSMNLAPFTPPAFVEILFPAVGDALKPNGSTYMLLPTEECWGMCLRALGPRVPGGVCPWGVGGTQPSFPERR